MVPETPSPVVDTPMDLVASGAAGSFGSRFDLLTDEGLDAATDTSEGGSDTPCDPPGLDNLGGDVGWPASEFLFVLPKSSSFIFGQFRPNLSQIFDYLSTSRPKSHAFREILPKSRGFCPNPSQICPNLSQIFNTSKAPKSSIKSSKTLAQAKSLLIHVFCSLIHVLRAGYVDVRHGQ